MLDRNYLSPRAEGVWNSLLRQCIIAFPDARKRTRLDHIKMIKALRASWRDELIKLTRRHLKPSPQAYIRVYD